MNNFNQYVPELAQRSFQRVIVNKPIGKSVQKKRKKTWLLLTVMVLFFGGGLVRLTY